METKKIIGLLGIFMMLFIGCLFAGCMLSQEDDNQKTQIANPASTYCIEQGGKLEIRRDSDENEYGICKFSDGSECEEWAFYRGECSKGNNVNNN